MPRPHLPLQCTKVLLPNTGSSSSNVNSITLVPPARTRPKKASAASKSLPLAKPIHIASPNKPAFFVRRSDALHHMPPAIVKPSILDGLRIDIDEYNKVDLDLEIFASMLKQAKVVSAEPAAATAEKAHRRASSMMQSFSSVNSSASFAEPLETRASLESRIGKKMMSVMPKYDMLFHPASSAPFLPQKTIRTHGTASQNNILDAIATVKAQSSDQGMVGPEPYYSKRMDVIVIVEHCCSTARNLSGTTPRSMCRWRTTCSTRSSSSSARAL